MEVVVGRPKIKCLREFKDKVCVWADVRGSIVASTTERKNNEKRKQDQSD